MRARKSCTCCCRKLRTFRVCRDARGFDEGTTPGFETLTNTPEASGESRRAYTHSVLKLAEIVKTPVVFTRIASPSPHVLRREPPGETLNARNFKLRNTATGVTFEIPPRGSGRTREDGNFAIPLVRSHEDPFMSGRGGRTESRVLVVSLLHLAYDPLGTANALGCIKKDCDWSTWHFEEFVALSRSREIADELGKRVALRGTRRRGTCGRGFDKFADVLN